MDANEEKNPRKDDDPLDDRPSDPADVRERITSRSPDAIADTLNALLDNPVFNQALKAAFGARDLATDASNQTLHTLNIATSDDHERLVRRMRSVSDRIEDLEDYIDRLEHELADLRKRADIDQDTVHAAQEVLDDNRLSQERLGLSE